MICCVLAFLPIAVLPLETDVPLHNPMKGWAIIDHAIPGELDAGRSVRLVSDGTPFEWFQNAAVLSTWAFVEKEPDVCDWSLMDAAIDYWSSVGKTIHLRFSTDEFGVFRGCPEWVYALGVPKSERNGQSFPDYTHPLYLERLRKFLGLFSERFCTDPRIETIDLRAYGNWGEWHSGHPYATVEERVSALRRLIDVWREANAGRKYLLLSSSYEWETRHNTGIQCMPHGTSIYEEFQPSYRDYLQRSVFDYAFRFPDVSLRRDGVGGAVFQEYDGRLIAGFFHQYRKPMFMEFFGGLKAYRGPSVAGFRGTKEGDDFVENAVDEALSHHADYCTALGWLGQQAAAFYNEYRELIISAHKRMGYRLVLVEADFPDRAAPGQTFFIRQTWENRGVGRCYRHFALAAFLMRDAEIVWMGIDERFDPTNLVSGETYDAVSVFAIPENLPAGEYDLRVALVNTHGRPVIELPIAGGDPYRRYLLGKVTVAPQTPAPVIPAEQSARRQGEAWILEELLRPDTTYLVSFRYQIGRDPVRDLDSDDPGFSWCYAQNADHIRVGETRWFDKAGQPPAFKTLLIPTEGGADYQLVWDCSGGGDVRIDSVRVEELDPARVRRLSPEHNDFLLAEGVSPYERIRIRASRDRSQVRLPHDWFWFARTDPARVALKPNTVYTVWFNCSARPQIWQGDYLYLAVRPASEANPPDPTALGFFRWTQRHTTNPVRYAYSFRTGERTDYCLEWGIKNGGECELARVTLVERN